MKYLFTWNTIYCLSLVILLTGCETDVGPAGSGTFVKFYGNINDNEAIDLLQMDDGGFLILGNETLNGTDTSIILIQTDRLGNETDRTDRSTLGDSVKAASFLIDNNQHIIILGEKSQENGTKDLIFFRLDQTLQLVDTPKTFGGINTNEKPADLIQLDDGNFAVLGHTDSLGSNYDMLIVKMDSRFQPLWTKIYGILDPVDDFGVSLLEDLNGDLIWLGNMKRGSGERNVRLVRSNQDGDILQDEKFINGNMEIASDLKGLPSEFVVAGTIINGSQSQILLKRTDLQFNTLSQGFPVQENGNQWARSVNFTRDNAFIIGGTAANNPPLLATIDGSDNFDMLLLVVDQSGTEVIRNTFGGLLPGVDEEDNGVLAVECFDGGFVFLGLITFANNKMISLIKTDKRGKLDPE